MPANDPVTWPMDDKPWIGVDLDSTLAKYTETELESLLTIGEPVSKMVSRVQEWLNDDKKVKIFTSRVDHTRDGDELEPVVNAIYDWCEQNLGQKLEVTSDKDQYMLRLWDDRAMPVVPNTGEVASHIHEYGSIGAIVEMPFCQQIRDWTEIMVDPEHVCPLNGLEMTPHVTVLYGFTEDQPEPVAAALQDSEQPVAVLGHLKVFPGATPDAPDVLYAEVNSPDLVALHNRLLGLPIKLTHATYVPHLTLGYLKNGLGKQYESYTWPFAGTQLKFSKLEFSDHWGRKTSIQLRKPGQIDVTTFSDVTKKFINGIESFEDPVEKQDYSVEYLKAALDRTKRYLPVWMWKQIHKDAMPSSGGKSRWRDEEPSYLEKQGLHSLTEEALDHAWPKDVKNAWEKLKKWHVGASSRREPLDALQKASVTILRALDKHKLTYEEDHPLVKTYKSQPTESDVHVNRPLGDDDKKKAVSVMKATVPTKGPVNAKVAFIGASPSRTDAETGEPLSGLARTTFQEKYLDPLDLKIDDVLLTNAVPVLMVDDEGVVREPMPTELAAWQGWVLKELGEYKPQLVVALSQKAKSVLGDIAKFVMPHPIALTKYGDSGEVGRKIKQVAKAIKSASPEEVVDAAYQKMMAKGKWAVGAHEQKPRIAKVGDYPDGSLYRVSDGWGERYFSSSGNTAKLVATKMADVHAYYCEKPVSDKITKDKIKEMGWGDVAWDTAVLSALGGEIQKEDGRVHRVNICKTDTDKQIVTGVVLEPDTIDTQYDTMSADEIEESAYRFLVDSRVVGRQHSGKARAEVVESYLAPSDFYLGGEPVKKGSWVMSVHVLDLDLWNKVKSGEITGFSVGGVGNREPIEIVR